MPRPLVRALLVTALALSSCKKDPPSGASVACPAAIEESPLPAKVADVEALRAKGTAWSDADIRARYVCWASAIGGMNERWKGEGLSAEARAHRAFDVRHDARVVSRAMMKDRGEVDALHARDVAKYGNPDGPTFDWLVLRAKEKGLAGDAVYEDIVASAQRTDTATNERMGVK